MTELRDYQQEMLGRVHRAWRKHQSVMVQMPTGTGKTHLMAAVIREQLSKGVLVVAHKIYPLSGCFAYSEDQII